jgi:hypothetical protein
MVIGLKASSRQAVCAGEVVWVGSQPGIGDGVTSVSASVGVLLLRIIVDSGCGIDWVGSTFVFDSAMFEQPPIKKKIPSKMIYLICLHIVSKPLSQLLGHQF